MQDPRIQKTPSRSATKWKQHNFSTLPNSGSGLKHQDPAMITLQCEESSDPNLAFDGRELFLSPFFRSLTKITEKMSTRTTPNNHKNIHYVLCLGSVIINDDIFKDKLSQMYKK